MTRCPTCGGLERNGKHTPDKCIDNLLGRKAKLELMLERLEYMSWFLFDEYGDAWGVQICHVCDGVHPADYDDCMQYGGWIANTLKTYHHRGHREDCELKRLIEWENDDI